MSELNLHEAEVARLVSCCEAAVAEIRFNAQQLETKLTRPASDAQREVGMPVTFPEFGLIECLLGHLLQYIQEIQKRKLMGKPPGKGRAITEEKAAKVKRWLREGKPYSVAKLAEKLDVSRQTIYNFLKEIASSRT